MGGSQTHDLLFRILVLFSCDTTTHDVIETSKSTMTRNNLLTNFLFNQCSHKFQCIDLKLISFFWFSQKWTKIAFHASKEICFKDTKRVLLNFSLWFFLSNQITLIAAFQVLISNKTIFGIQYNRKKVQWWCPRGDDITDRVLTYLLYTRARVQSRLHPNVFLSDVMWQRKRFFMRTCW